MNKSHNIFSKINSVGNEKEKENLSDILDLNKKIINSTFAGVRNGSKDIIISADRFNRDYTII